MLSSDSHQVILRGSKQPSPSNMFMFFHLFFSQFAIGGHRLVVSPSLFAAFRTRWRVAVASVERRLFSVDSASFGDYFYGEVAQRHGWLHLGERRTELLHRNTIFRCVYLKKKLFEFLSSSWGTATKLLIFILLEHQWYELWSNWYTHLHGFNNFLEVLPHLKPVFFCHCQLVHIDLWLIVVKAGEVYRRHSVNCRGNSSRNNEWFLSNEAELVGDAENI